MKFKRWPAVPLIFNDLCKCALKSLPLEFCMDFLLLMAISGLVDLLPTMASAPHHSFQIL